MMITKYMPVLYINLVSNSSFTSSQSSTIVRKKKIRGYVMQPPSHLCNTLGLAFKFTCMFHVSLPINTMAQKLA